MTIQLPFGRAALPLDTGDYPTEVLASGVVRAGAEDGRAIVERAMAAPFGGVRLEEMARGCRTATVIISDHTRPVPSIDILPPMLAALRAASPGIAVSLLVATGFHRATTAGELRAKLGPLMDSERVVVHDCADEANLVDLGVLPSGARLVVNRLAAETDLLLAEGFIEPHFFAGYSGGRKSVLPGVCGRRTVLGNHCSQFIAHPTARTGVLAGNPIHRDMVAAAEMARLRYIVNVTLDGEKRTAQAFAGQPAAAHAAGCKALDAHARVAPAAPADIVVATNGGAPLDQNIYQAVKGLCTAESAAAEGAVLIICAECADGTGSDSFYAALRDCASPAALLEEILQVPQEETRPDQWQAQILARIMGRHRVLVVSHPATRALVAAMKLEWMPTAQAAWDAAVMARPGGRAAVLPDGVSVFM